MSDWNTKQLGEIAGNVSRPFKFEGKDEVIFINTGDVLEGKFLHADYSPVKGLPGQAKKAIKKGDILYSEIRPGNKRYVFVDFDADDYVVSTKFMVVRPTAEVSSEFLYMLLTSKACEEEFKIIADSRSGTFPQITFDSVSYYPIRYPDETEQDSLVEISSSLLDKIELNRQTNQTLEQIAQAIFKSWFVDFEPTRAKIAAIQNGQDSERAAMAVISGKTIEELTQLTPEQQQSLKTTAALFPDTLVDSELGEIPDGWGIQRIEDIIELAYGKALKKTDRVEGAFPVYGSGGLTGTHNESLVDGPGVIVGRKGTVGAIYWEDQSFFPIDTVFYVKCKEGMTLVYSYYLLQTLGLEDMNTDAAVPGLNRNNAYRLEIPKVPDVLVNTYSTFANALRQKMSIGQKEEKTLIELRNSLLPKLLSGELLNEQQSELEEVINAN